jgi:hypothetical protein
VRSRRREYVRPQTGAACDSQAAIPGRIAAIDEFLHDPPTSGPILGAADTQEMRA